MCNSEKVISPRQASKDSDLTPHFWVKILSPHVACCPLPPAAALRQCAQDRHNPGPKILHRSTRHGKEIGWRVAWPPESIFIIFNMFLLSLNELRPTNFHLAQRSKIKTHPLWKFKPFATSVIFNHNQWTDVASWCQASLPRSLGPLDLPSSLCRTQHLGKWHGKISVRLTRFVLKLRSFSSKSFGGWMPCLEPLLGKLFQNIPKQGKRRNMGLPLMMFFPYGNSISPPSKKLARRWSQIKWKRHETHETPYHLRSPGMDQAVACDWQLISNLHKPSSHANAHWLSNQHAGGWRTKEFQSDCLFQESLGFKRCCYQHRHSTVHVIYSEI